MGSSRSAIELHPLSEQSLTSLSRAIKSYLAQIQGFECGQQFGVVVFSFELVHDRLQLAVLTDDKGRAQNAVKLTAHELLGAQAP